MALIRSVLSGCLSSTLSVYLSMGCFVDGMFLISSLGGFVLFYILSCRSVCLFVSLCLFLSLSLCISLSK